MEEGVYLISQNNIVRDIIHIITFGINYIFHHVYRTLDKLGRYSIFSYGL